MFDLPAHWYRGGTSKCWFFDRDALTPHASSRHDIADVLARVFDAADPRHIDGIGGATSTTAKAAVIRATPDGPTDLEYLFAQVGIGDNTVEFDSNCGNCATAVGLYAVTEGLVAPAGDVTTVRMWNENSRSVVTGRVHTPGGRILTDGDATVPGTNARGVPVDLVFESPAGVVTGQLLPTGNPVDALTDPVTGTTVHATCVDAGAPATLIRAADLGLTGSEDLATFADAVPALCDWRRRAALAMGLNTEDDPVSNAVPKVGVVGPAVDYVTTTGQEVGADEYDVSIRMVSMLAPHPAIGLTSAVAVAAALSANTTVREIVTAPTAPGTHTLRLGTFAGVVAADVEVGPDGALTAVALHRAARRIASATVSVPSR